MSTVIFKEFADMNEDVAIIIPSRIGSQRLYQKPLQKIGNYTMIEHMINQVKLTGFKNIFVATDSELIARIVEGDGAKYIMTDSNLASGTDRVYAALQALSKKEFNYIVNVQGDMPFIEPEVISKVVETLKNSKYDIITPITKVDISVANSQSNVKVVIDNSDKALYFSRSLIPIYGTEFWYHVGIYGFKQKTLEKFVKLPHSNLEICEKLEQLRALENNIEIGICYVDNVPISIDTQDDLNKAIEFYNREKKDIIKQ